MITTEKGMALFEHAQRYIGIREVPGEKDHPLIRWWHSLCTIGETEDEVPWCSSFINGMCWDLRRARSKSAAARSWLGIGIAVPLVRDPTERLAPQYDPQIGDIVILSRATNPRNGHVGIFGGWQGDKVMLVSGNIRDMVTFGGFSKGWIIGIRRV